MEEEEKPYTWADLKALCNRLDDEQLSATVRVIQEDSSIEISSAGEIGDDHYKFDDEEFSITKADFDADNHCDGKYKSFEEALEKEDYQMTPKTAVFLYEKF